ncbi:MAG TPA: metalloregulator ArsR/SmtB family transcription factor [Chitinophagales bacterium]|nr:metalloregulator ArsR/SmtB family transcription factor [Chitinophagales bacterium]
MFQAIADPTRRAILLLLATQALTPNALAEHFDLTRQAVSKHVKVLAEAELVKQKKTGREIYYEVNATKVKDIEKWLLKFKGLLEQRFSQLDDVLSKLKTK